MSDEHTAALNEVLARIEGWQPDTVAVAVTDARATLAAHGDVDAVLELASVTKPLTAYATLIAVADGALHLDEPVDGEVPDGTTVRHLLAHASGLATEAGGPATLPERKRIYSNFGYEVLADLVAGRVGRDFAEHLDVEVLQPLGMDATELAGSPAHGARGTVTDLCAFARELLDPQLLDPQLHAEATTVAFPGLDGVAPGWGSHAPNDWGLGFEIRDGKAPHWTGTRLSPETFGHFGGSGSFLWVDPTRGLAAAELASQRFGGWAREAWPDLQDAIVEICS